MAAAQMADRYISDRFLPDKAIDLIDEAGARLRIRRMTAPPDLREFDEKVAAVRLEKEAAIDAQDFERAAGLRDDEKKLLDRPRRAGGAVEVRRPRRRGRGGRGDHRRGALHRHRHPGVQADRGGVGPAAPDGGGDRQALHRPARRGQGAVPVDPPDPGRPEGPEAAERLVHLRRPVRRRQDRADQGADRVPVRRRGRADPAGHERVLREAHRFAAVRLTPRLRRLRGGRPAHREGAPQAVQRGAVRRGREGPPGHLQLAAADPGRGSADRRPGPGGRLQEHGDRDDHQPGHPGHRQERVAGLQPGPATPRAATRR